MGGRQGQKEVPHGGVGESIFAEVEQLTTGGATTRLAAFEAIAKRTDGQTGTVAANYYRIARKRGVSLRPRRTGGAASVNSRAAVRALATAAKRLGAALQGKERELATLRKENRRFAELRKLLK
jgi:hypothetical protein